MLTGIPQKPVPQKLVTISEKIIYEIIEDHFFHQQNKLFACKFKFKQANNRCQGLIEASRLALVDETKDPMIFLTWLMSLLVDC